MDGWDLVREFDLRPCLHSGHTLLMAIWRDVQVFIKEYKDEQA